MESEYGVALEPGDYDNNNSTECIYLGTDFLEVKIFLIGVFAVIIAIVSLIGNSLFTYVFITSSNLRRSPLYYFGVLAIMDTILALNYLALMVVPVYMDYFEALWLNHIFLSYFRPMIVLSNTAMFGSVLLILMATMERLLLTFPTSHRSESVRKFMEGHRPVLCAGAIVAALSYKLCTYFEIVVKTHDECEDWAQHEIAASDLVRNDYYRFWWMFAARNLIDRIIPFFGLLLMNIMIIRTIKKENKKFTLLEQRAMSINEKATKRNLRDATRALIAVVTLYICAQFLQVIITFWEALHKHSLENDFAAFYSYINDVMSIMMLLCSALRYPVYCSCNRPIFEATRDTLAGWTGLCASRAKKTVRTVAVPSDFIKVDAQRLMTMPGEDTYVVSVCLDDSDEQWVV